MVRGITWTHIPSFWNHFGIIQVLQRSPILQTSNWSGTFIAVSYSKPALKAFSVLSVNNLIWHLLLFSAWLEASFQDELDPGNAQHEEHARNLVVTLVQQLEAKALESGDFLTKNKLEEIIASIKVRLKLFKLSCGVSS